MKLAGEVIGSRGADREVRPPAADDDGAIGVAGAGGTARAVLVVLVMGAILVLGVVPVLAGDAARVDLFDAHGRRTGYAIVDRATGRVDFYDTMSRRTGYGRVDGSGRVERFGPDGRRQGETVVPVPPRDGRR